jgi:hypothetical protein
VGRRVAILVFLCLTLLMGLIFPEVWERAVNREDALPPGISAPDKRLLRVWLIAENLSASSWLKRQATRFEDAQGGVSIYLRTARPQELSQPDSVLPDLIVFGPGTIKNPESMFLPLTGEFPLADGTLRAGRWQTLQYAVPICMDGYVLVFDPALTGGAASTPAPTPLLGIGGAPSSTPAPEKANSFHDLLASLAKIPRGKNTAYDFQCAAGMPLMLFSSLCGGNANFPTGSLPLGFGTASRDTVFSDFLSSGCRAAMIPSRYLRSLAGQNKPFALMMPPLKATDMYLAAGIIKGEGRDLALKYLMMLLSPEGQQDLYPNNLMAVSQDVSLYGADPVLSQVEGSFKGDLILPNAFAYDEQGLKNVSLSVFTNGGAILDIFESIR